MNNMNFPRAGELHRRPGRQAAQQGGPVSCTQRRAGELWKSLPDRLFVQSTDPAVCFSFGNTALQPARPAGPPISVIPFFKMNTFLTIMHLFFVYFLHIFNHEAPIMVGLKMFQTVYKRTLCEHSIHSLNISKLE